MDEGPFSRRLQRCHNVHDLRRLAKKRLPFPIYDHIAGGADDEVSLAANRATYGRFSLVPRQCAGLEPDAVDMSTRVLGQTLEWPVISSPWGMQTIIHPDGEIGLAEEVHATGSAYGLSAFSEVSLEDVARAAPGPKFFQLQPSRSREIMGDLLDRARAAGYVGVIVTVDNPTHGNRERDRESGLGFPPKFTLASWLSIALKPRWALAKVGYEMTFANYSRYLKPPEQDLEWLVHELLYSATWDTMRWIVEQWKGPIAIKGILSPADARAAVDVGFSAVIVSNQGARHFDSSPAPFTVLPDVVDEVGDEVDVLLDGGVRRGTDVLKAIAFGARAVTTARPFAYGLAASGREGARRALYLLKNELRRDMVFMGVPSLASVDRSVVMSRPVFGAAPSPESY